MPPRRRLFLSALATLSLLAAAAPARAADSGSLLFDKPGHVACGDVFNVAEGTIEFWFKPASCANNVWVISKRKDKASAMEFGFGTVGIMYAVKTDGEWTHAWIDRDQTSPGEWRHVACVFTKTRATLYLDGRAFPKNMRAGAFGLDHLAGGEMRLGQGVSDADRYKGLLGPVRLSDNARYDADFTPEPGPFKADAHTVAVWNMAEESGPEIHDAAGRLPPARIVGQVGRAKETPVPSGSPAGADEFGVLPVLRVAQPPKVDSALDDACWRAAAEADGFAALGSGGWIPAPKQTTVKLAYDDKRLYLAAVCLEPEMAKANAGVTQRDGPVYDDDCLEIFLDVNNDRASYIHYVLNSLGAYYDGLKTDKAWNSEIQVSAKKLDDRWILEAAIPFDQLKTTAPKEGALWGFNAAREHRRDGATQLSTWAALPGGAFHAPAEFAHLRFAGDRLAGSPQYSNLKPVIRNPAFSEMGLDGKPLAWILGARTTARETAYLAGVYHLATDADDLMARQETSFRNVAGRRFEFAVSARAEGGACLGVTLRTETAGGAAGKIAVMEDQRAGAEFETLRARVAVPADVARITAVELRRSNDKGTLVIREIGLADASEFREVREAADDMPAHRRPVGESFVSPCVAWANPLAGGSLNVLFILASGGNREAVELAQRLEMKSDIVWVKDDTPFAFGAAGINARLARRGAPYDVIILGAALRNERLARAVRDNVAAGTGLVCLLAGDGETLARALRSALPPRAGCEKSEPELARLTPWRWLPSAAADKAVPGAQPALKSVGAGAIEKGKIVVLGYGGAASPRGVLPRADGEETTELSEWWEYAYALIARSAIIASNRAMPASIRAWDVDERRSTLTITVAGQPGFSGALRVVWAGKRHVADGFETLHRIVLGDAPATVAVAVPAAVARARGVHVAQLFLRDSDGKAVDWGGAGFAIEGTARLAAKSPFPTDCYRDGEKLEGVVAVENAPPGAADLNVTAELADAYDRVVWSQTRPAPTEGATLAFAPGLDRVLTVFHTFRATLAGKQGILDRREWPIFLRDRWNWVKDDFRAGVNCDYFIRAHTDQLYARWFQSFGMKITTEGGAYDDGPRHDMPWMFMNLNHPPMHNSSRSPVRNPCFNAPGVLDKIAEQTAANYNAVLKYAPEFCSMADESELVRDGTAEVCFCPHCAARFRLWTQGVYGSLDKVNAEWGTAFKTWDEIEPIRADEARRRGNPAQWADFREFMDDTWIGAFIAFKKAVKRQHPDAMLGLTDPFVLNPFSGEDHYKSAINEDAFGKYAREDITKEIRSFNPAAPLLSFYGYLEGLPYCKWYPWWFAFNRGDYLVWWSSLRSMANYDLFDVTGRHTARSLAVIETTRDLIQGAGKAMREFRPVKAPVAIVYSQSSMRCSWIESDMKIGDAPWASNGMDRLPASNPFGLNYKSRDHFKGLLKENGAQPDFLAPEQIEAGKLDGRRLLILPCVCALSDATLARVDAFVRAGGVVVADLRLGVYSEHGKPLASRPGLESLFGFKRAAAAYTTGASPLVCEPAFSGFAPVDALDAPMGRESLKPTTAKPMARFGDGSPAILVNEAGKGKAVYLNFVPGFGKGSQALMAALLDLAAVDRPVRLAASGKPAFGYDTYRFVRGQAEFIGVLRDMPPLAESKGSNRVGAVYRNAGREKEALTVLLPKPNHVYNARAGKYLGRTDAVQIEIAPSDAALLALLPYQVKAVIVTGANPAWRRGEWAEFSVAVAPEKGEATDHIVRVETFGPDGRSVAHYSRNALAPAGHLSVRLPLALNERAGAWKVKAMDVASGLCGEATFNVEE